MLLVTLACMLLLLCATIQAFESQLPESWQAYSRIKMKMNIALISPGRSMVPPCQQSNQSGSESPEIAADSSINITADCMVPRVFMLRGRSPDEVRQDVLDSWAPFSPIDLPAREKSQEMLDVPGCEESSWANRLFAVYQGFFRDVLRDYPDEKLFVFVEDDALLLDVDAFRESACSQVQMLGGNTQQDGMEDSLSRRGRAGSWGERVYFYSFFRVSVTEPHDDCFYYWGTQVFLANREMLLQLISLPAITRCRTPIDIYMVRARSTAQLACCMLQSACCMMGESLSNVACDSVWLFASSALCLVHL